MLTSTCTKCGFQNPAAAKFCSECGTGLIDERARSSEADAPAPSTAPSDVIEGERKTITVMFADIQDSMDLLESLDPEDARRLVDPALDLMVEVVRRFDGRVVQSTGDGIFAIFGAPIAHEDHPQRAVYAALELQESIRRYSESMRQSGRAPILVRVSVNTGEVVVRSVRTDDNRVEYTPIGHPTSLASRLQSLATPGAVVVGEQTKKLCEGFFKFTVLGPRNIKGVRRPVTAYEVVEVGPLRTRLEAAARRGLVKFVGRQAELDEMNRALELAQSGHGQIVGVVGDAGLGKSRLFHQFKSSLGGGVRMLETSGIAHAERWVYLPLMELLQKYFNLQRSDETDQRRGKIEHRLSELDPALLDTVPYLNALLGVPEADDPIAGMDRQLRKQRTLDTIKRLLVRESLAQPLLVIFEDLHWFDSESLEFLTLLADSIATMRILMLVNFRPGFSYSSHAKSYYRQLRLDPLAGNQAEELLSSLLTDGAELRPLKQLIIEKSEGNPLFIEEIVRAMFENGTLVREGEQVRVTRPHAEITIPAMVEGIIAARIDRLRPEEKSLLQGLAVIGEEFALPVALQALGKSEDQLLKTLACLQSAEFIYARPSAAQPEYIFKHTLIHDVAYKSMLQERRKAIHGKTAESIEKLYGNRLGDHLDKLVHHYRLSGNGAKTVHYLHQAGQHAYERSAVSEAVSHFNSALETIAQLPSSAEIAELELALQISLGNSLMSTGGFAAEGIAKAFGRARELCGVLGDSSQLVPALFGLWVFHNFGGKLKAAQELGAELLAIAERRQDPAALLMAHTSLGITLTYAGELRPALEHCTHGVAVFSPTQRLPAFLAQARSSCHTWLAMLFAFTGRPEPALRVSDEAVKEARQSKQTVALSNALIGAGVVAAVLADPTAIKARSEELIGLAQQEGFVLALAWAQIQHGYALTLEGNPEAGIAQMLGGLTTVRAAGALTALAQSQCWLAEGYVAAGQAQKARAALADGFAAMDDSGERLFEAELYRVKGEIAMISEPPDRDTAEGCFRTAIDNARGSRAKLWELRAALSLAVLLVKQGRRAEASAALSSICESLPEADIAVLRRAKSILGELNA
jgi:class 3 adenylate cyclase/predicted ATPase